MDPFSSEGGSLATFLSIRLNIELILLTQSVELLTLQNAFHQGQFSTVIEHDISGVSAENKLAARVYVLRARIASGDAESVLAELEGEDGVPDLAVVRALAEYESGDTTSAVEALETILSSASDNAIVQVVGATILHSEHRSDEALRLLGKHQGNLEACVPSTALHIEQSLTPNNIG